MKTQPSFALILILLLSSVGCVRLHYIGQSFDGHYAGLHQRMDEARTNNATLRIIMVHGMGGFGPTQPGYGDVFANDLAAAFHLSCERDCVTNSLVCSDGITNLLRTFDFTSQSAVPLKFYELTWSPTTTSIKANQFVDDQKMDASGNRLPVNRNLKQVVDSGFGDAALYLNPTFRQQMQEPILKTLAVVEQESAGNEFDQIVFVTHSLGSKMTLDTILDNTNNSAVSNLLSKTSDIIMLANQLPLIDLGIEPDILNQPAYMPRHPATLTRFLDYAGGRRTEHKNRVQEFHPELSPPTSSINVVAATDPDDALSFPLTAQSEIRNGAQVSISDLYGYNDKGVFLLFLDSLLTGSFNWPPLLENPVTAHTGYLENPRLIKKLIRGFAGK